MIKYNKARWNQFLVHAIFQKEYILTGKLYKFEKLRSVAKVAKQEVEVYRLILKDARTPPMAKILLGTAVGYLLLPFDIIPDFIPVLGHLDDLVIVPALVIWAIKLTPREVIEDCRLKAAIELNQKYI